MKGHDRKWTEDSAALFGWKMEYTNHRWILREIATGKPVYGARYLFQVRDWVLCQIANYIGKNTVVVEASG
jgi:hypothetical protein